MYSCNRSCPLSVLDGNMASFFFKSSDHGVTSINTYVHASFSDCLGNRQRILPDQEIQERLSPVTSVDDHLIGRCLDDGFAQ